MAPTDADAALQRAVRLVLAFLPQDRQPIPTEIADGCQLVCTMERSRGTELDSDALRRLVEADTAIFQDESVSLENPGDHQEWLTEAKADRTWEFWDRYRRYLEDGRAMPRDVVRKLDHSTDKILRRIEDPRRPGRWHRTGLVVGQVQSGKTGNYIGLACKAADAGYRLIVILAGIHNSLRSQTQLRVDEGLLGFDTQYQTRYDGEQHGSRIGAGALPGAQRLPIGSLTTSNEKGDFGAGVAKNTSQPIGGSPTILVVKKHVSILEYLRRWVIQVEGVPATGPEEQRKVLSTPLLIIDDEADNASINTRNPDTEPSGVNAKIRELLNSFSRSAYIGYTATPFANIYIDPDADHSRFGADLFPDAFIETLMAPSNYFGPDRVFGLQTPDQDEDDVPPLPVVRTVDDASGWMPDPHSRDWRPPRALPGSLTTAILSFVVSCAARRARGQSKAHNSMLVHVTRFSDVQNLVAESVQEHVDLLRDQLKDTYGATAATLEAQAQNLWDTDYVPTTARWPADEAPRLSWTEVRSELLPALLRSEVKEINGRSQDALAYYDHRHTGLSVIAVGGNKLSRGLTLEDLTISYYLRASRAYDTLLQMGRWFGYRPLTEDLCRLFTTPDLVGAYAEIAARDHELRRDFEEMAALGLTPRDFGLRVRESSRQLTVTAPNKMRNTQTVRFSFSADVTETTVMHIARQPVDHNLKLTASFLEAIERAGASRHRDELLWSNAHGGDIIEKFLDQYVAHPKAHRVRPKFIADYIRRCQSYGELTNWTVKMASNATEAHGYTRIAEHRVGLIRRSALNETDLSEHYSIRRLLSPRDELADLSPGAVRRAFDDTQRAARGKVNRRGEPLEPKIAGGPQIRRLRPATDGLLLLYPLVNPIEPTATPVVGFAVSFPRSPNAVAVEYRVNEIWSKLELEESWGVDDGDPDEE